MSITWPKIIRLVSLLLLCYCAIELAKSDTCKNKGDTVCLELH